MKYHPLTATFGPTIRAARFLLFSVVLMAMLGVPAFSQGTVGSILGDVTDATGARLPGATVRLLNEGTGATREALTSEVGSYRFNGLQPVIYTVTVEFPGFTTVARPGVKVNAASDTKIDFALDVSATVETITVTEQAPLVETTENTIKTLIDTTKIRELPLKSRDFMDLALLSPGVVTDQASDARGTLTDSVSFGGMGERFKSMWLEGVDINDEVTGGGSSISSATRTQLAQEAVQEFQVMANSYSSEFGRSATGVINIVTKSGTNEFHGNAFYFRRDDAFDKPNAFTGVAPPFKSQQWGGTIGGPIVEDKAHFFVSYERRSADQVAFVVIPPQLVSFVNSLGYDTTADVPNPWRFHNLFTKGSVTLSPEHTLNIVGVYDNRLIENTTAGGNLSFDSGYEDDRNSHFITVSLSSLFGSNIVNDLRVNRSDQELFRDSRKNRPSLSFPSIRFGRDNTQGRRQQNWILSNTTTWNVGNHTVKFGGEANRVLGTYVSSANIPGTYSFSSDQPVDPNDPSTLPFRFTQGFELRKGSIDVRGFDNRGLHPQLEHLRGIPQRLVAGTSEPHGECRPSLRSAAVAGGHRRDAVPGGHLGVRSLEESLERRTAGSPLCARAGRQEQLLPARGPFLGSPEQREGRHPRRLRRVLRFAVDLLGSGCRPELCGVPSNQSGEPFRPGPFSSE